MFVKFDLKKCDFFYFILFFFAAQPPSLTYKFIMNHEGLLLKQGGVRRNWKKRYFILKHGHLMYFSPSNKPDVSVTCIF